MTNDERGVGDNGGPPLEKFTATKKLERIKQVLEMDLTSAQKCIGIGIVVEADKDGVASDITTQRLQTFASARDRETVYKATKTLKKESVAEPIKVKGKPNSYRVLPPRVVEQILEAYHELKTSRAASDQGGPVKPDGDPPPPPVGLDPTTPVRSDPTRRVEPVGLDPTGPKENSPHTPLKENNKKQTPNPITVCASEAASAHEDQPSADLVTVNGAAIHGPNFKLSFASIDMAAGLIGMPKERARTLAEICARDWADNGTKPANPMAQVKAAIMSDFRQGQVQELRLQRAQGGGAAASGESKDEKRLAMAKQIAQEVNAKKQKGYRQP